MRSSLFLLLLSLIATFGWGLHTRLESLTETTSIDFSSLKKNMAVIESFEGMTLKEKVIANEVDYLETNKRLALLNEKLEKPTKVKVLRESPLRSLAFIKTVKPLKAKSTNLENVETLEADHFEFTLDQKVTSESYAFHNYDSNQKFAYVAINENINQKNEVLDEVNVAQAAPEKADVLTAEVSEPKAQAQAQAMVEPVIETTEANIATNSENKVEHKNQVLDQAEDDIKTFEYPNEEVLSAPPIAKKEEIIPAQSVPGVSANVSQVIQREMKAPAAKVPEDNSFTNFVDNTVIASAPVKTPNEYSKSVSALSSLAKTNQAKIQEVNTHLSVRAMAFNLQKGVEGDLDDFDVQAMVETNDIQSSLKGEVKYELSLGQKNNFKSLSLSSADLIKTNVNLDLIANEMNEAIVPMLNALSIEQVLMRNKIEGDGGMLLVKLAPEIVSMNLDKKAQLQIALDVNLKAIKDESKASYVLYVGIVPGNVMVTIKTDGGLTNYLTNVNANEMTYDAQPLSKKEKLKIELYNEELMSRALTPMNLMNDELVSFSTAKTASKLTLNSYEFSDEIQKSDTQNYFEVKKGQMDLFFGYKNNSKVILPSISYQDEMMKVLGLKNSEESCVIQINLKDNKNLSSVRHLAYTTDGVENFSLVALDKDGSFGEDISDTTTKIFLKGDRQGSVKVEFKYTNDTVESLQTFCSQGVYLVEQL